MPINQIRLTIRRRVKYIKIKKEPNEHQGEIRAFSIRRKTCHYLDNTLALHLEVFLKAKQ
jgi:hypothetical protein